MSKWLNQHLQGTKDTARNFPEIQGLCYSMKVRAVAFCITDQGSDALGMDQAYSRCAQSFSKVKKIF